jgi:hypothetical protein
MAVLLAALAVGSAPGSTQATPQYRAELNAMCRSTTVALRAIEAKLAAARAARNAQAYAVDLGVYLGLGLREDATIEATPIPAAVRSTMAPVVSVLRRIDRNIRAGIASIRTGNVSALQAALVQAARLTSTINLGMDRSGLRECGSNQS